MKKAVLIDTSSAILLFKSGWMPPLMEHYQVGTGPVVYQEMTVLHHPGATSFARWRKEHRLVLHASNGAGIEPDDDLNRLHQGERECIRLLYEGAGAFIILDDGRGAAYCRRKAIPYVNALLIPRLLSTDLTGCNAAVAAAIHAIYAEGHYAPWVRDYALNCPAQEIAFFLP